MIRITIAVFLLAMTDNSATKIMMVLDIALVDKRNGQLNNVTENVSTNTGKRKDWGRDQDTSAMMDNVSWYSICVDMDMQPAMISLI